MASISTTAPSANGFLPADGETTVQNLTLTVPLEESQTIEKGDFLTISTAGYWQKNTSNEAKIKGIAMEDVTSTAAQTSGEAKICVLLFGIVEVDSLVEALDGSSGYDADIDIGQVIFCGGNATDGDGNGQSVVAGDGTNGVTANAMGIALDANDGANGEATTQRCRIHFDGITNVI